MYEPLNIPQNQEALGQFLEEELRKLADAIPADDNYVQAQLLDKGSVVNTRLKREGLRVWDATNKRPVWAAGKTPTASWVDGNGTVVHTPV